MNSIHLAIFILRDFKIGQTFQFFWFISPKTQNIYQIPILPILTLNKRGGIKTQPIRWLTLARWIKFELNLPMSFSFLMFRTSHYLQFWGFYLELFRKFNFLRKNVIKKPWGGEESRRCHLWLRGWTDRPWSWNSVLIG